MNKYKDFIPTDEKGVTVKKGLFFNNPSKLAYEIYFYPMFGGEYQVSYPYQVKRNFMDSFLLIYIKNGEMKFHFHDQVFYAKNEVVLLDCKELNYYSVTNDTEFYFLHFNSPFMQKIFDQLTEDSLPVFHPYKNIENLFIRIFRLVATNSNGKNDPFLSNLTYALINNLTAGQSEAMINHSSDFHSIPDYISTAVKYMDKNYSKKVKVNDIAFHCSISPSQLSRDFRKFMGTSIHGYLLAIRIKHAKSLLVKDITTPLDKVAISCGFTDASHLYKKIKEDTGLAPGEFRKKYY